MSAAEELRSLLAGRRPAAGLLQTVRLELGGTEFYGEEAVLERGRAAPVDLARAEEVRGPAGLALFGESVAAVADLHGERVGRVWVLGALPPAEPEAAVMVAFDPDLLQARAAVFLDAADHPDAAPPLLDRLAAAGARLVEAEPGYRARAFLIRAWGDAARGAGLFAVHRLGPGPVRASGWSYAAVRVTAEEERVVADRPVQIVQHHRL
jgi:hypothetical protein